MMSIFGNNNIFQIQNYLKTSYFHVLSLRQYFFRKKRKLVKPVTILGNLQTLLQN